MADISKCANSEKCPKKNNCYRHTAKPHDYQSWPDFYKKGEVCEHYLPLTSR